MAETGSFSTAYYIIFLNRSTVQLLLEHQNPCCYSLTSYLSYSKSFFTTFANKVQDLHSHGTQEKHKFQFLTLRSIMNVMEGLQLIPFRHPKSCQRHPKFRWRHLKFRQSHPKFRRRCPKIQTWNFLTSNPYSLGDIHHLPIFREN